MQSGMRLPPLFRELGYADLQRQIISGWDCLNESEKNYLAALVTFHRALKKAPRLNLCLRQWIFLQPLIIGGWGPFSVIFIG